MFKDIDINSKSELEPYFKLVDYKASEYCLVLYICGGIYLTQNVI